MLLVLLAEAVGSTDRELWLTPDLARRRYGLSAATRSSGLHELVDLKAVRLRRRSVSRDVFDYRRMRNVYQLNWPALNDQPIHAADTPELPSDPGPAPRRQPRSTPPRPAAPPPAPGATV